jgi:hypothetical protein
LAAASISPKPKIKASNEAIDSCGAANPGMLNTKDNLLWFSLNKDLTYTLFTGRRLDLGKASGNYYEKTEEYKIPAQIDSRRVWGFKQVTRCS